MPTQLNDKTLTWCPPESAEIGALEQISRVSNLPFVQRIAVMPDFHLGRGAAVGSVVATQGAIVPSIIGVDIGCSMLAVQTTLQASQLPDNLQALYDSICRSVPLGAGRYKQTLTPSAEQAVQRLLSNSSSQIARSGWVTQLGTLGGGNHFIELCLDQEQNVWVVLHSGSRGIGNQLATRHIKEAQRLCAQFFIPLEDKDLAYLPEETSEFEAYITDLLWAQRFAQENCREMMQCVLKDFSFWLFHEDISAKLEQKRVFCHHNYTRRENHFGRNLWISRKGAVSARTGELSILPGSMSTPTFVVSGLGNKAAMESAPHGAGRRMSRTEGRKRFTLDDFDKRMAGICCRRDEKLIDELEDCYKDVNQVVQQSQDLLKVEYTLHQILNIKGD